MSNSSTVRPGSKLTPVTSPIVTKPTRLKVTRSASSLTSAAAATINQSSINQSINQSSIHQPISQSSVKSASPILLKKKPISGRSPSVSQSINHSQPVHLSLNSSPTLHSRNLSLPINQSVSQSPSTAGRRRISVKEREEQKMSSPTMSNNQSTSQSSSSSTSQSTNQSINQSPSIPKVRRRLSVMSVNVNDLPNIDGLPDPKQSKEAKVKSARGPRQSISQSTNQSTNEIVGRRSPSTSPDVNSSNPSQSINQSINQPLARRVFSHFASLSKVGYIPFNPHKVNQDRALEVLRFNQSINQSLFAVFDGHGALGHEVSTFLTHEIPRQLTLAINQLNSQSTTQSINQSTNQSKVDPLHTAIIKAFLDTNTALSHLPHLDCTFSGSTACLCLLINQSINQSTNQSINQPKIERRLLCANVGDSRAVIGRIDPVTKQLIAVALSNDQKPDRPDEKARVLACRGRIEACKGSRGEDIGPARVWLPNQDVPGLAMTRSFGDLIAASVGVIARPEVSDHQLSDDDQFMVIGSDGIWEFMSNEEVVFLVGRVAGPSGERAEDAARALVDEATRRWRQEEEVIDDCTAIVVWY